MILFILCIFFVNGELTNYKSCGESCQYAITEDRTTIKIQVTEGRLQEKEIDTLLEYKESVTTMIIECELYPSNALFSITSTTSPMMTCSISDLINNLFGILFDLIVGYFNCVNC